MDRQLKGYDRSTGNASFNLEKSEKRPQYEFDRTGGCFFDSWLAVDLMEGKR
jgi:hypothetical protein